jgi:hypothetical protein
MARYLLRKQEVSVLRHTVEESLRSSVARQMERGTRVMQRSLLLGGLLSVIWFPFGALVALVGVSWGYFRMKDLDRGFVMASGLGAAVLVIGLALCFGKRDVGYLIYRGLWMAALLMLTVRSSCGAYGKALAGINDGLAEKWKKQWRLLRNTLLVTAIVFLLSIPLGLADLWAISILAGGSMGLFFVFRGLWLLSGTVRSCREYLSRKKMVDSLGQWW